MLREFWVCLLIFLLPCSSPFSDIKIFYCIIKQKLPSVHLTNQHYNLKAGLMHFTGYRIDIDCTSQKIQPQMKHGQLCVPLKQLLDLCPAAVSFHWQGCSPEPCSTSSLPAANVFGQSPHESLGGRPRAENTWWRKQIYECWLHLFLLNKQMAPF